MTIYGCLQWSGGGGGEGGEKIFSALAKLTTQNLKLCMLCDEGSISGTWKRESLEHQTSVNGLPSMCILVVTCL